jgi:glycolate oxidase
VLVQLASSNAAEIDKCLESLAEKELNISLLNSKQAEEAWAKREDLPVILADNNAYKMDICIPIEQLGSFLLKIEEIGQTEIYSFGHLGDGNIHLNIVSKERELELIENVYSLLKDFGGSPSAEHGIGQRKKNIWSDFPEYQSKYLLLKKIKKSLDPKNILSPKVFFSD